MKKYHFFKPVFYNLDTDSVLFRYDEELELIRLPQFTVKKEIKTTKDLVKAMEKIFDFMTEVGIEEYGEPYASSIIETLDGREGAFFFLVEANTDAKLPKGFSWMKYEDAIKDSEEIAWWDKNQILAYIPHPDSNN